MTLQQSTYHIPHCDGKNPPLKDFLQDVSNGALFVTDATEPGFIKEVLVKLRDVAPESVRDKQFSKVKDLIAHLKKRFAPTKKYQWYFESIVYLQMEQSKSVSDYNDRVQGLLNGARHAIEEKYTGNYRHVKESLIMMKPVVDCALDAFIRGHPDDVSIFVNTLNPRDLGEALEHALHAEERQRYTEKSKNAVSSYHIMRPRDDISDRPRSPSPYSRQIGGLDKRIQTEKTIYHYPYTPHPSMMQHPTNDKGQKPTGYQSWAGHGKTTGGATPPRCTSPNPPGNLNSQPTCRPGAATSQASPKERPKFVHFGENSVGSYDQDALKKTHQPSN